MTRKKVLLNTETRGSKTLEYGASVEIEQTLVSEFLIVLRKLAQENISRV